MDVFAACSQTVEAYMSVGKMQLLYSTKFSLLSLFLKGHRHVLCIIISPRIYLKCGHKSLELDAQVINVWLRNFDVGCRS